MGWWSNDDGKKKFNQNNQDAADYHQRIADNSSLSKTVRDNAQRNADYYKNRVNDD